MKRQQATRKQYVAGGQATRKRRRRRKKRRSILSIVGPAIFALVVLAGLAGYFFMRRYSYGTDRADLHNWFGEPAQDAYPMVIGNEQTGAYARRFDGYYYISLDDLHTYISNRFYYGEADGIFVYTTPTAIITNVVGTTQYTSTTEGERAENYVVSRLEGDTLYVALEYVKKFCNIDYAPYEDPNHISMYIGVAQEETALITKDTKLRVRGGIKSDILKDLEKGDRVVILDEELGDWIKVRTDDAYIGYVESKRLSEKEFYSYGTNAVAEEVYTNIQKPYTICLGWHQIGGVGGNDTLEEVVANTRSMNTISPTWFGLSDNNGAISSFGTTEYVTRAHGMGLEVWGLVSNFANEGIDVKETLSRAASRQRLVDNLMNEARRLGLDGINVDFENVPSEAGRDYVQFIRELSIACRAENLVLSIDNYVPYGFNDYYDRTEQGVVADYVIIMGYDEHYAGSPEAGSVASIEYVRYGIEATLAQVPAEKVINAVPFYTRIWTTSGASVSSFASGMKDARDAVQEYGISLAWDNETEQYYGATTNASGDKVEVWMEDAESIQAKVAVMRANHLAGIAGWRLGLETVETWDVIADYVNGNQSR